MKKKQTSSPQQITIVLAGQFQHGKSTLARLLSPKSQTAWGDGSRAQTTEIHHCISHCNTINFMDCPGVNDQEERTELARHAAREADVAILVALTEKNLNEEVKRHAERISKLGLPAILVLNCKDPDRLTVERNDPSLPCAVRKNIRATLDSMQIEILREFSVNLGWAALATGLLKDSKSKNHSYIRKDWEELYPDDPEMKTMYDRSNFEPLRKFLLEPNADLFAKNGLLVAACLGRIRKKFNIAIESFTA